jgi:hypothetical protein
MDKLISASTLKDWEDAGKKRGIDLYIEFYESGMSDYIGISGDYTIVSYGRIQSVNKLTNKLTLKTYKLEYKLESTRDTSFNVNSIGTSLSNLSRNHFKEIVKSLVPLIRVLSDMKMGSGNDIYCILELLTRSLDRFSFDSIGLDKETKQRLQQMSDMYTSVKDENERVERELKETKKQLQQMSDMYTSVRDEKDKLLIEHKRLKTNWDRFAFIRDSYKRMYKELNTKTYTLTKEEEMEIMCRRAKEGAIKQREARERLAKMYEERCIETHMIIDMSQAM